MRGKGLVVGGVLAVSVAVSSGQVSSVPPPAPDRRRG